MPVLHFYESGRELFAHPLRPGRTVVGRSDRCDIALPSDSVSRVHCMVEQRGASWHLTDRSRHGTKVNTEPVERAELADGDVISIGRYEAHFSEEQTPGMRAPTAAAPMPAAIHEELVALSDEGYAASRAEIRFTKGPSAGSSAWLSRPRSSVGGSGAQVRLDPSLAPDAAFLRVVRGRVMVEPGSAATFLAGVRVRTITPVVPGEEVRVGDHAFVVETATIEESGSALESFGEMVGSAPLTQRLFGVLHRVASHDAPVLLCGESGTGKELAARGIHDAGPRHEQPFVPVNCAAVTETLFESELFGHEKGAFTGATARQDGAFQRADRGTLFLDEVGELSPSVQAKLLRVLESGEVRRVGGSHPEYPDGRVIAATNRNLPAMVKKGTFREDLYFRLAVLTVRLPALRERRADIAVLARTLLARNHPNANLTPRALGALQEYGWPGNIRELRNVLTRAVVMGGPSISAGDLQFNPWAFDDAPAAERAPETDGPERTMLEDALAAADGNRTRAARALGMPRSSLLYKLRKHGLM